MAFCSRLIGLILVISLCGGCAFRSPALRAVPAGERIGAQVLEGKLPDYLGYSTRTPALMFGTTSATAMDSRGIGWLNRIRTKSGISETKILADAVRETVQRLDGEQASSAGRPLVYVALVWAGIEELERGGFFGVSATGAASLLNTQNKVIWHGTAKSSSTHFRRREEYEQNPALYEQDFREAAADIARQLVDGPIRSAF